MEQTTEYKQNINDFWKARTSPEIEQKLKDSYTYGQLEILEKVLREDVAKLIDTSKTDEEIINLIKNEVKKVEDKDPEIRPYPFSDEKIQKIIDEIRNDDLQWEAEKNPKPQDEPIKFITAADAMKPRKKIEWLIEGLIRENSLNVFYGDPGSGKTWALLNLAVCVAEGNNWLNFKVSNPKNVLFIDEESGEDRVTDRLHLTLNGAWGTDTTPINILSLHGFRLDKKTDDKKSDWQYLKRAIEQSESKLVIIDALADVMTGDENTKQDTQPLMMNLRKLADATKCAIILIHHSGKNGNYRGSSAISGAVDLLVKVTSDETKCLKFKTEKCRDIVYTSWNAEMVWDDDNFYLKELAPYSFQDNQNDLSENQKQVIDYLTKNGQSKLSDIVKSGISKSTIYSPKLVGKIRRTNPSENKRIEAIFELVN